MGRALSPRSRRATARGSRPKHATNRIMARAYSVLDASELSELVDLTGTAHKGVT